MRRFAALFVLFSATAALASNPGQPLDCDDFVVSMPGISVEPFLPYIDFIACDSQNPPDIRCLGASAGGGDAAGALYFIREKIFPSPFPCFDNKRRYEIWRTKIDGTSEVIASIEDRCGPQASDPHDGLDALGISVDQTHGYLGVRIAVRPRTTASYLYGYVTCRLRGFTTMFDVLQSFTPGQVTLGFRTPYMPEGMRAADHFDTYWGAVTQPLDLANAHPLQCAYPPSPPSIGDYLQITAPVPTPAPGHANYVLTSVTYQGQTRAGRKASDGRLTGRDASRLPVCIVE